MSYSIKKLSSNTLPKGTYKATVEDVKEKVVNGVKTSDLQVNWRISEGSQKNRTLMETIVENAFGFKLAPFANATGLDINREFATKEELINYIVKTSKGATAMINVDINIYNGNEYNKITGYSPLPGSSTTTEEVLDDFDIEPIKGVKPHIDDLPMEDTSDDTTEEPLIDQDDIFDL